MSSYLRRPDDDDVAEGEYITTPKAKGVYYSVICIKDYGDIFVWKHFGVL